ncbi:hypothetical protein KSF78_0003130 [Schistosoma japonicum]|nr:hypothetical protein KSF78_0003130 [Schistosoma japonicum]
MRGRYLFHQHDRLTRGVNRIIPNLPSVPESNAVCYLFPCITFKVIRQKIHRDSKSFVCLR